MILTPHQQDAFKAILDFTQGHDNCFILKGSAGTGKTTLLSTLAQWLICHNKPFQMLAPTGRAARILGEKTKNESSTIHGTIYGFDHMQVNEEATGENDPGMRFFFNLRQNDRGNTLFIVDEASMVGDLEEKQDLLRFGSGRLLADLVTYTRIARPGRRPNDPGAKLLFVGDPAQLPPVGQTFSPALSPEYLVQTFQLSCVGHELTEVLRQQGDSAILERATALRDCIEAKRYDAINLRPDRYSIHASNILESINRIADNYRGIPEPMVLITYSNATALKLNRAVRGLLWGDEQADLQKRDLLLVNRNNGRYGLFNGDLVWVLETDTVTQRHMIYMRGVPPVELIFRKAIVGYRSKDGNNQRIECVLLQNLLNSPERALTILEQRALLVYFHQRHEKIRPGTDAYDAAISCDPWFNPLQVKYGYALTCHKAQGGEWDTAIVNFESGRGNRNEDFFRWTYTAITRAKRFLVTIGAPSFDAYSNMNWGRPPSTGAVVLDTSTASNNFDVDTDPDWLRFSFSSSQINLFIHHCKLRESWYEMGIVITGVYHLQYCEHYRVMCGMQLADVAYWYKGDYRISKVGPFKQGVDVEDSLLKKALHIMRKVLLNTISNHDAIESPFILAFITKLEEATTNSDIRIISRQNMQYRLRVIFADDIHQGAIDFCYDSVPKWTKVEEVGCPGGSHGLIDKVKTLLDEMI